MSTITRKMLREVFERERDRPKPPTLILFLNQHLINLWKSTGKLPCTTLNTTTGEFDFTAYGKYAEEIQKKWEDYNKEMTTSPYGLPLHIDLPGVDAPELEEEGDDEDGVL